MLYTRCWMPWALAAGLLLAASVSLAAAPASRGEACLWIDQTPSHALADCAQAGDVHRAQTLIGKGTNVNTRFDHGTTALMIATLQGDYKMVAYLLSEGADPNLADVRGDTALAFAAETGQTQVAQALLDHGATPDEGNIRGITPLMRAAAFGHTAVVRTLLGAGADVNATIQGDWSCDLRDCMFKTALEAAQMNGHADVVALLKHAGARS